LWLHEGLANYVSIGVTYYLGLTGAKDLEDSLTSTAAMIPQSEYHLVEAWPPYYTDPNSEFQYYAMAYTIVSKIGSAFKVKGEPFPGYDYYAAFFRLIEDKGEEPNSTAQIISDMEYVAPNASGVDSMFFNWGFDVPNVYLIYLRIQLLRQELLNSTSVFVPSMTKKLDEAERFLKGDDIQMAQELVTQVEAFINYYAMKHEMWSRLRASYLLQFLMAMLAAIVILFFSTIFFEKRKSSH
jgi:hypothetical protein